MIPAAVMQKWIEGAVAAQTRWTERLFSLKVEADISFEAGQFAKLALPVEGEMLARPYSFVNAPDERPHEFYYVTLPDGPLTQRLCKLVAGDRVYLAPRPAGFLALSEVPEGENLWLISTGTGIGPFLSILKTVVLTDCFKHTTKRRVDQPPDNAKTYDSGSKSEGKKPKGSIKLESKQPRDGNIGNPSLSLRNPSGRQHEFIGHHLETDGEDNEILISNP